MNMLAPAIGTRCTLDDGTQFVYTGSDWQRVVQPEKWQDAVIDELVICGIYCKEHDTDPRKAVSDLVHWHVSVALDPAVTDADRALAWSYELAHTVVRGTDEPVYGDWRHHLTVDRPDVPAESIRNLRRLYAGPVQWNDLTDDEIEEVINCWWKEDLSSKYSELSHAIIAAFKEKNE